MNNCKKMDKKCEYADRLGMCENITATCARNRTMSRNLIDMDTLTEMIKRVCCHAEDETDLLDALKETPTIDAVEVKHGEWMRYGEDGNPNSIDTCIWQCDQCLETYYGRTTRIANYCPNCGAKMDGERRNPCSSQDS